MGKTNLREVLEAIAASQGGMSDDKDAVALLGLHLKEVQACQHTDELAALVQVRDGARRALETTAQVRKTSKLAASHGAQLEQALAPLERLTAKMLSEDAKPRYLAEKKKLAARIALCDPLLKSGACRGAAAEALKGFVEAYSAGRTAMERGEAEENYALAFETGIVGTKKAVDLFDKAQEAYAQAFKPVHAAIVAVGGAIDSGGAFADVPGPTAAAAKKALAEIRQPSALAADGEFATAYAALEAARVAAKTFRTAAAALVLGKAKDGDERQRKAARSQADKMIRDDPDALKHMVELDGGKDVLDALMADIGDKASSDADKAFVEAALKARYDIKDISGEKTRKALPRLYKVLASVPESHTLGNPKLAEIERNRKSADSTYDRGKLLLNTGKTGRIHNNTRNFDPDDEVPKEWKVSSKNVSDFDQVTLHELGHSVDDKLGFMDGKKGAVYGGWKLEDPKQIAELAGTERGFYKAFKQFPQAMLRQLLLLTLQEGKFPASAFWSAEKQLADAAPDRDWLLANEVVTQAEAERVRLGVDWSPEASTHKRSSLNILAGKYAPQKDVLRRVVDAVLQQNKPAAQAVDDLLAALGDVGDPPQDQVWQQMAAHAAIVWCLNVGRHDVWNKGRAGARENADAAGVVVYTRLKNSWYSYLMSARGKCVSSYQFNSPAEWFAELYAAYYMDKLPEGHPDHGWMTSQIHAAA